MPDSNPKPVRRRDADGNWQVGPSWESLTDRQIREAMEEGSFDNLPHRGEPLPNDENPHAAEWGLAFHVLRNAGYAPPWIEADKEVRELLARLDALVDRASKGAPPSEIRRRRDIETLQQRVNETNAAVARLNSEAPSYRQQRHPLRLADEIARYENACHRSAASADD